jgi:hypothetical protein
VRAYVERVWGEAGAGYRHLAESRRAADREP